MKKLIVISFITLAIFIGRINSTNNVSAKKASPNKEPIVSFYLIDDSNIGFTIDKAARYKTFPYKIEYLYGNGQQGLIEGTINNTGRAKSNTIVREFYLGTCSSSICVDNDFQFPINLTLKYGKGLQYTVSATISN